MRLIIITAYAVALLIIHVEKNFHEVVAILKTLSKTYFSINFVCSFVRFYGFGD